MSSQKKIAIVYDWIDSWGGVERILLTFHEMFPNADFFTSYVDYDKAGWAKDLKIRTSFIQNLPDFIKKNRKLSFPLYPYAFESFNFNEYDVVISVTSSFAKAVVTKPETLHICYLLTPTRYLWLYPQQYLTGWQKALGKPYFNNIKNWDYVAAQRPDKIITISQTVADRCKLYYHREATVIYPPFDLEYWKRIQNGNLKSIESFALSENNVIASPDVQSGRSNPVNIRNLISNGIATLRRVRLGFARDDNSAKFVSTIKKQRYFLIVSRLEPYKKVDLAIEVFNQTGKNLVIVGNGTQLNKLKQQAKPNIKFISDLPDQELAILYSQAEGLIMPQEEDFGYVALEAQYFGCPVIAFGKGGVTETIITDKTGIFFMTQDTASLKQALEKYDKIKHNLKQNLKIGDIISFEKYNIERFKNDFITHLTLNN